MYEPGPASLKIPSDAAIAAAAAIKLTNIEIERLFFHKNLIFRMLLRTTGKIH